ncbi:MAG: GNAT family N-acetyltransferase [Burkholderiales bacterium]|nr:GNAT family N-acetyltransferase [Burkholderiales bacterium]
MLDHTLESSALRGRAVPELAVSFARTPDEVVEAQRLRYKVFAGELGANIPQAAPGIDSDFYDAHCEHLLVRDTRSGEVVGTYRLLPGPRAQQLGSFYADSEFDLTRLRHLRESTVEIGRSCVHPDYRSGATIARLWSGLAAYAAQGGYRYLMGCASLGMADGGRRAAGIYRGLAREHLSPVEYRVFPRCELPLEALGGEADALPPPLVKGYVRVGAWICGAPAWDPDFNTADLLMLLPLSRMNARYARHFLNA